MAYIKWTFRIVLILLIGGFVHYTLPQRDIVRVINTYEERQDFGGWNSIFWSGGSAGTVPSSSSSRTRSPRKCDRGRLSASATASSFRGWIVSCPSQRCTWR